MIDVYTIHKLEYIPEEPIQLKHGFCYSYDAVISLLYINPYPYLTCANFSPNVSCISSEYDRHLQRVRKEYQNKPNITRWLKRQKERHAQIELLELLE